MRLSPSSLAILLFFFPVLTTSLLHAQSNTSIRESVRLPKAVESPDDIEEKLPSSKLPVKFAPAVLYSLTPEGSYSTSVAVGDLNGDGRPDVVVGTLSNVVVLLGNGDGTLQSPVIYEADARPISVALADVNGDGHLDVIVANECEVLTNLTCDGQPGAVSVFLGNGDGTLQPAVNYSSGGNYAVSVAVADLNADGHPDLVIANYQSGNLGVLLGRGDGTFQDAVTYATTAASVVIGDLNGDGKPDLVVANGCEYLIDCFTVGNGNSPGEVSVLLGNGDGTFQAPVTYPSGQYEAASAAIADVNGDHIPDLVVANECETLGRGNDCGYSPRGGVAVLIGNGDGTFQPPTTYPSGGDSAVFVAVDDVNGDGKPDIVTSNFDDRFGILPGFGNGAFQSPSIFQAGANDAMPLAIADLNGDGRPDLIAANFGDTISVLLNVLTVSTTTKLISSPNPSAINQSVVFTATVSSSSPVPDGSTVTFYNDQVEIGTGATMNNVATLSSSFSMAKAYTIRASYAGDAFHTGSSKSVKQVVDPYTTKTVLSSGPNPSNFGQAVGLTAIVTTSGPVTPTGTVKFYSGTMSLGTGSLESTGIANLSTGIAKLSTTKLALGTDSLTASYHGDIQNGKSTSSPLTQTVNPAQIVTHGTSPDPAQ